MEALARSIAGKFLHQGLIDEARYDCCLYGLTMITTSSLITLVMLAVAIISGLWVQGLVYVAVHWGIHSVAESYHCKKYYQCFMLSMSFFMGMVFVHLFTNAYNQLIISWMLLLVTGCFLLIQLLDKETVVAFSPKHYWVYGGTLALGLVLLLAELSVVAFPYMYGMLVINALQAKVRRRV